jgi:hypothetical protein
MTMIEPARRRSSAIATIETSPTAAAAKFIEWRASHSAGSVSTKSAGSLAIDRPNRSLSWLTAMIS